MRAAGGATCGCGVGALGITCATCGAARDGGAATDRLGATAGGATLGPGGSDAIWGAGCGCATRSTGCG